MSSKPSSKASLFSTSRGSQLSSVPSMADCASVKVVTLWGGFLGISIAGAIPLPKLERRCFGREVDHAALVKDRLSGISLNRRGKEVWIVTS